MKIPAVINTIQGISNPVLSVTVSISNPSVSTVGYNDSLVYDLTFFAYALVNDLNSYIEVVGGAGVTADFAVTGSGGSWQVTLTNITGNGPVGIKLLAGAAEGFDASITPETLSVTATAVNAIPVVSISDPSMITGDTTTILGTYWDITYTDADVINLTSGDISFDADMAVGFTISDQAVNVKRVTISSVSSDGSIRSITVAPGTSANVGGMDIGDTNTTEIIITIPAFTHLVDGSDGDLVIQSGETYPLAAGSVMKWNSLTIEAGGTLQITGSGITELGVRNDLVIDGTITMLENWSAGASSKVSEFTGETLTFNMVQSSGGSGGNGSGATWPGGSGGSGTDGHGGGGGGGGAAGGNGNPGGDGGFGGANGSSGTGNRTGLGGVGGATGSNGGVSDTNRWGVSIGGMNGGLGGGSGGGGGGGSAAGNAQGGGGGGGGGGHRGRHGGRLHIYCEGSITGAGNINLNGQAGFNGAIGSGGNTNNGGTGGAGGSGGGGAGGNGGRLYMRYRIANSNPTVTTNAATFGFGATGGPGANGTNGIAGNPGGFTVTQIGV